MLGGQDWQHWGWCVWGAARLVFQSEEGRRQDQVGWRERGGGVRGGEVTPGSAGQGAFSLTSPGSSLLSSTSPLFMPLPLGCQIWLTQSVVSLLRLAPGPKPSERITSPLLPLHEERRGRARGPGGKGPTLNFPVFLLTLLTSGPGVGGFGEQPGRIWRHSKGSRLGEIPGPGQEVRPRCWPLG